MKKIICCILVLLCAAPAFAGLKEITDAGTKGQDFITLVEDIKTFDNTNCAIVANIETAAGIDLKSVTTNQIQAYFSGITLSAAQLVVVQQAAVASDRICEFIDTLTLPATDN